MATVAPSQIVASDFEALAQFGALFWLDELQPVTTPGPEGPGFSLGG